MHAPASSKLGVVIVGGGMITHDQILPSLYHLQRLGQVGAIRICALNSAPLRTLARGRERVLIYQEARNDFLDDWPLTALNFGTVLANKITVNDFLDKTADAVNTAHFAPQPGLADRKA